MKKKVFFLTAMALGFTATTMAQNVPSYVPTNSLVGWWPFNGNAIDESINTNDGTVNGATLTADRFGNLGNAFSFYGTNDFINVSTSNNQFNNSQFSIAYWFKSNQQATSGSGGQNVNPAIISRLNLGGPQANQPTHVDNFCIYEITGSNNLSFPPGGVGASNTLGNTWKHIVFVIRIDSTISFVNGVKFSANPNIGSINFQPYPIRFGRSQHTYWKDFSGELDDIGYWNRPLNDCEIKKLYTSGSFSVSSNSSNTICVGQSLNLTASGANSYVWSTGAISQSVSVSPTVSTVYTVSTTYSAGCTDSRTFSITVNTCTGLNEINLLINDVQIFPNPAKEQLNINLNNTALIGKKYAITNALGQVMATGIINNQTMELTIQQFSSGLYQLNIDGLQENYKFIKE